MTQAEYIFYYQKLFKCSETILLRRHSDWGMWRYNEKSQTQQSVHMHASLVHLQPSYSLIASPKVSQHIFVLGIINSQS